MTSIPQFNQLGLDEKILKNPKLPELLPQAKEMVDNLDELQYAGANPKELGEIFNNLPPDMKVLVKALKEEKNQQAKVKEVEAKAQQRLIGSSVDRKNSQITQAAKEILKSIV